MRRTARIRWIVRGALWSLALWEAWDALVGRKPRPLVSVPVVRAVGTVCGFLLVACVSVPDRAPDLKPAIRVTQAGPATLLLQNWGQAAVNVTVLGQQVRFGTVEPGREACLELPREGRYVLVVREGRSREVARQEVDTHHARGWRWPIRRTPPYDDNGLVPRDRPCAVPYENRSRRA